MARMMRSAAISMPCSSVPVDSHISHLTGSHKLIPSPSPCAGVNRTIRDRVWALLDLGKKTAGLIFIQWLVSGWCDIVSLLQSSCTTHSPVWQNFTLCKVCLYSTLRSWRNCIYLFIYWKVPEGSITPLGTFCASFRSMQLYYFLGSWYVLNCVDLAKKVVLYCIVTRVKNCQGTLKWYF